MDIATHMSRHDLAARIVCMLCTALATLVCAMSARAATEFTIEQLTTADGLANNTVRAIARDASGRMWFATSNGVSLYDGKTFTNLRPSRECHTLGLADRRARNFWEDKTDRRMWIETMGGYSCYDMAHGHFISYADKEMRLAQMNMPNQRTARDTRGRTWRVTSTDGLYVTLANGHTEHYTTTSKGNTLPTNALKCVYIDDEGTVWIGTDNLGVSRITVTQNEGAGYVMNGENIRMMSRLRSGIVAVANRSGSVWLWDSRLEKALGHERHKDNTYCMTESGKGSMWRGSKGGGAFVDGRHVDEVEHNEVYSIYAESDTCVWIGTFGDGLILYDPASRTVRHRLLGNSYGNKRVRHIIADSNGHVWVATSDGVYAFLLSASAPPRLSVRLCVANGKLVSDEVRTIFADTKGRVFIAESGEGFAVWNKGHVDHYTMADSLANDMVQCFVEDRQGFVWMSTEFGISRFNPATKKIRSYFFSKNMLSNVFNENSGALLADGRIAFGSSNGVALILPSAYNADENAHGVDAKDILINGQSVRRDTGHASQAWLRSPWARAGMALAFLLGACALTMAWNRDRRLHRAIHSLSAKKDELAAEKQALSVEKSALAEEKDRLERDIHIERDACTSADDLAFIDSVERVADSQLSNPSFSADDFASMMGMGRTAFFKKMKELTGYSPSVYVRQRRLHRAARLLATTALPVSEIASMTGISDPLYFSRVFKTEYKCTPTEWRKQGTGG